MSTFLRNSLWITPLLIAANTITAHIPHPKLSQIKKALKVVHNN
jgi:hypothetical protein